MLQIIVYSLVNNSCTSPDSTAPTPSDTDKEPSSAGECQIGSETFPGVSTWHRSGYSEYGVVHCTCWMSVQAESTSQRCGSGWSRWSCD